jgi:hypothetical protein
VRAQRRIAKTGEAIDGTYALVVQVSQGQIIYARDLPGAAYREFLLTQRWASL